MTQPEHNFRSFLIILILVFIAAWGFWEHRLLNWDDDGMIRNNPYIKSFSATNVKQALTGSVFKTYRPTRVFVYMVGYSLFGYWAPGYIAINLLWWVAALYALLQLLVRAGVDPPWALVAVLLYGLSPLRVESVIWISALCDPMFLCFAAWSGYYYLGYLDHGLARAQRANQLALALLCYLLALLSKPVAIVLPLIFGFYQLIYQRLPPGSTWVSPAAWADKVLLGLVTVPVFYKAILVAQQTNYVRLGRSYEQLQQAASVSVRVFLSYVWATLVPSTVNPLYRVPRSVSLWQAGSTSAPYALDWPPLVGWIFLGLYLLAIGYLWLRRQRAVAFCLGSFLLGYLPFAGIMDLPIKMADRYVLISGVFGALLIALALQKILELGLLSPLVVKGIVCVLIAINMLLFSQHRAVFASSRTLWEDHLADFPESGKGNYFYGRGLLEEEQAYSQAVIALSKAYRAGYRHRGWTARLLARAYEGQGDHKKAAYYRERGRKGPQMFAIDGGLRARRWGFLSRRLAEDISFEPQSRSTVVVDWQPATTAVSSYRIFDQDGTMVYQKSFTVQASWKRTKVRVEIPAELGRYILVLAYDDHQEARLPFVVAGGPAAKAQ